jgi:hypothetical protein
MHIQREWVTPVTAGAFLCKQMQVLGALFAEAKRSRIFAPCGRKSIRD